MSDQGPFERILDRWEREGRDGDREGREDREREPRKTALTATDREMGVERGLMLAYLDCAIDALRYLRQRTQAGRQWIVSDAAIDEEVRVLEGWRGEVLRGERAGARARGSGR